MSGEAVARGGWCMGGAAAAANVLSLAPAEQQWVVDPLPPSQRGGSPGAPLVPGASHSPGQYLPPRPGVGSSPATAGTGDAHMADGDDPGEVMPAAWRPHRMAFSAC